MVAVAVAWGASHAEPMATDHTTFGPAENEHRFGFHKATVEGENATLPAHRDTRLL